MNFLPVGEEHSRTEATDTKQKRPFFRNETFGNHLAASTSALHRHFWFKFSSPPKTFTSVIKNPFPKLGLRINPNPNDENWLKGSFWKLERTLRKILSYIVPMTFLGAIKGCLVWTCGYSLFLSYILCPLSLFLFLSLDVQNYTLQGRHWEQQWRGRLTNCSRSPNLPNCPCRNYCFIIKCSSVTETVHVTYGT